MTDLRLTLSVVIPVFNRPDLLQGVLEGLALQSVNLNQIEVLVCDDGSTEDLSDVVRLFESRLPHLALLHQKNQGPAAARNLGIRNASSELVLFLDSDVLPEPHLVERLQNAMQQHPEWIGAEARVTPIEGEDNNLWDAPVCQEGGVYLTAAIVYRRATLVEVGGFDENFKRAACEDVELAARMLPHGHIGFVQDAVIEHPRRRKTLAMYWKKRNDWRYVLYLAQRHGFIGWPGNITNSPRLRLLWCALVTQPAGRLLQSLQLTLRNPSTGLTCVGHAVFSWFCGLAAVPDIATAQITEQRTSVLGTNRTGQSRQAA